MPSCSRNAILLQQCHPASGTDVLHQYFVTGTTHLVSPPSHPLPLLLCGPHQSPGTQPMARSVSSQLHQTKSFLLQLKSAHPKQGFKSFGSSFTREYQLGTSFSQDTVPWGPGSCAWTQNAVRRELGGDGACSESVTNSVLLLLEICRSGSMNPRRPRAVCCETYWAWQQWRREALGRGAAHCSAGLAAARAASAALSSAQTSRLWGRDSSWAISFCR